jgi:hypothetical protein
MRFTSKGEWIHFGSERFPNRPVVGDYLRQKR